MTPWAGRTAAFSAGGAGGYVFYQLHLPLPWLLGAMSACLVLVLLGAPLCGHGRAAQVARTVLGVAIGSAFTPAIVDRAGEMAGSLMFVPPYVLLMGSLGFFYFHRIAGFDRATAFFSAMPGGLQDMIAMGRDHGANERTMALVHATRVIVLVFLLPFVIQAVGDVDLGQRSRTGVSYLDIAPVDYLILLLCAAVGWYVAARLRLSGATIVGPMLISAAVHVLGGTGARPPIEAINVAQWIIGVNLGCMYLGSTAREIARAIGLSLGFIIIILAMTALFASLVSGRIDVDLMSIILAFSPGGQSEMNLIALVLGVDVAYVALHHLLRVFLVIVGAQVTFGFLGKNTKAG